MKKAFLCWLAAILISTPTIVSNAPGAEPAEETSSAATQDATSNERAALDAFAVNPIPQEYRAPAEHAGKIVRFDYDMDEGRKFAYVYVPYGYNRFTKYDVLYLMHGGGDNQWTFFGDDRNPSDLKNAVDHLIERGAMAPILIVTPPM